MLNALRAMLIVDCFATHAHAAALDQLRSF